MNARLRLILYSALIIEMTIACKPRNSSSKIAEASPKDDAWVVWAVKWKNKVEIVDIGETQPDGGMAYDAPGMEKLAWLIEDMLLQNTFVDESLLQFIERQAKLSSETNSSQIARNTLPKQLIPPVLWNKGIRWDFFIWPLDYLKPENIEQAYKRLKAEDREKMQQYNPLLATDEITFQKLMLYYRDVYNLPVFQRIRVNVQKDQLYQSASKSFQTATSQAMSTAISFIFPPISSFWKYLIPATGRLASTGRFLGTMFTLIIPGEYVAGQIHNAMYQDQNWRENLQDLRAIRQDGAIKGPEFLEQNRAAIEWFRSGDGARIVPHFAKFLTDPHVSWFLLDPVNCYELQSLVKDVKQLDQNSLAQLNAENNESKVQQLIARFADGLGPAGRKGAESCTSQDQAKKIDAAASKEIAEYIRLGSKSPLFNEMLLLTLVRKSDRKIILAKDPRHAGVTSSSGPIQINSGTLGRETNTRLAMTYTLAHETWHAVSKHWIFNQLFKFSNAKEFLMAISGDETVASLLSLAVRDEIKRDRNGFLENAEDFIDSMNFLGNFSVLSRFNPQDLQKGPILDVVTRSQTNAFKEWRGESIPLAELPPPPQNTQTPWYVQWFSHLGGIWAQWFPTNSPMPCDVYKSMPAL